MRLSCGELVAKEVIQKKFGWKLIVDRTANLTVPLNGRPACHYCDECQRGCFTASYFNSPSVTLPAAARTGRFHLVSDAVVSHLLMNAEGKADGVAYIDRTTHAAREARAKVVVLAASALESTRILLNSRSRRFPNGVGNSTGVLGHYLMDHITLEHGGGTDAGARIVPARAGGTSRAATLSRSTSTPSPDNQNKNFLRGYYFAGDGRQELYGHASTPASAATGATRCAPRFPIRSASTRKANACRATITTSSSTRRRKTPGAFPRCTSTPATAKMSTPWPRPCAIIWAK